jgi:oxygen-dependent protoporphyrinogen oxidase
MTTPDRPEATPIPGRAGPPTGTGSPVTIIGAGIAGLAAAHQLHRTGHAVTIVEADPQPGGKLRTSKFAGRMVDESADAFLLRVPWALDLCRDLGLDAELVHPASRNAYIFSRGELRPLPPQVMGVPTDVEAVARGGILSPAGLERLRQDLRRPSGPLTGPDTAIGAAIEVRLGGEALDRLVDPLVGGINAGDTRRLSLAAVVPQIDAIARDTDHASLVEAAAAAQRRAAGQPGADPTRPIFAAHPSGMARLVEALVDAMPGATWHRGRRAVALEPLGPVGGPGRWRTHLDDGGTVDGGVVLALPAFAAAPLLAPHAAAAAAVLDSIEHASVALVALAVRPDDVRRPLDGSGFLVPRIEDALLTACSWASAKWSHLGAESGDGTVVLRASAGRAGDGRALDLDDADLVERLVDDLGRTMGLSGAPTEVRVNRWIDSFPQYAPGHLDRVADLVRSLAVQAPGLALAGAALNGVGIPACIRSGIEAARLVAATTR